MTYQTDVYLDTHVLVFLYQSKTKRLGKKAIAMLEDLSNNLLISTMLKLELTYLYQIGRLNVNTDEIINYLSSILDLTICQKPWINIINVALHCDFTRDAFDRLIASHAMLDNSILISKDENLTKHYDNCVW